MKCHQCSRPALYQHGGVRLCLDCESKRVNIDAVQFLQTASMLNQSLDEMDDIFGGGRSGGRIPIAAIASAMRGNARQNHISISHSTVGAVNTGDLCAYRSRDYLKPRDGQR